LKRKLISGLMTLAFKARLSFDLAFWDFCLEYGIVPKFIGFCYSLHYHEVYV
jgi:hypothetical protein